MATSSVRYVCKVAPEHRTFSKSQMMDAFNVGRSTGVTVMEEYIHTGEKRISDLIKENQKLRDQKKELEALAIGAQSYAEGLSKSNVVLNEQLDQAKKQLEYTQQLESKLVEFSQRIATLTEENKQLKKRVEQSHPHNTEFDAELKRRLTTSIIHLNQITNRCLSLLGGRTNDT